MLNKKNADDTPSGTTFDPNMNFDLADLDTTEVSTPTLQHIPLSARDQRLNKALLRIQLERADRDDNGQLDADELRAITDVSAVARTTVNEIKNLMQDQYDRDARQNIRLGRPQTANGLMPSHYYFLNVSTSTLTTDPVLINRPMLVGQLVTESGLSPKQVDNIVRRVLPRGIAEIKLSDECVDQANAFCAPHGPGMVKISLDREPKF